MIAARAPPTAAIIALTMINGNWRRPMYAEAHSATTAKDFNAPVDMKARQTPLQQKYALDGVPVWVIDEARTSSANIPASQPLYTQVTIGDTAPVEQSIGVHSAVGGRCDLPNPGEMLAAALASCLDSTTRIIANRLGIPLTRLEVSVSAKVDVRGTLRVKNDVPVGFQDMDVRVEVASVPGVSDEQIGMLIKAAEHSCVVLQTLRNAPRIDLTHG